MIEVIDKKVVRTNFNSVGMIRIFAVTFESGEMLKITVVGEQVAIERLTADEVKEQES